MENDELTPVKAYNIAMARALKAENALLLSTQSACISERSKGRALFYALEQLCDALEALSEGSDLSSVRKPCAIGRTAVEALRDHYE